MITSTAERELSIFQPAVPVSSALYAHEMDKIACEKV